MWYVFNTQPETLKHIKITSHRSLNIYPHSYTIGGFIIHFAGGVSEIDAYEYFCLSNKLNNVT